MIDWRDWIERKHPGSKPEWVIEALEEEKSVLIPVDEHFKAIMLSLRLDGEARFDQLHCISGVDKKQYLEVVYILFAFSRNERLKLKVRPSVETPEIPSIVELYPSADWHEREVYDMFGVYFLHHPDMRRILMPDDWEGHPLRKDYVQPEFYSGWRIAAEEEHRTARPVN